MHEIFLHYPMILALNSFANKSFHWVKTVSFIFYQNKILPFVSILSYWGVIFLVFSYLHATANIQRFYGAVVIVLFPKRDQSFVWTAVETDFHLNKFAIFVNTAKLKWRCPEKTDLYNVMYYFCYIFNQNCFVGELIQFGIVERINWQSHALSKIDQR